MNWKKESENELRDYRNKQEALNNIPSIFEQIDYELKLINNRKSSCSWEDIVINNIMKRSELERNLLLIRHRVDLVERGLYSISTEERRILELFYFDRSNNHVKELRDELSFEKSSIYNKKDTAIRQFTLAMYGINEL